MLHWDDLRYLLALDDYGTMTKAAKALRTNPTTVSRHIKRLSEAHKQTLITRQRGGEWVLTDQGKAFARTARRCQREISLLGEADQEETACRVTISANEFVARHYLIPQLKRFRAVQNGAVLTLDTEDRNVSLAYGEADMALRLGRPTTGCLIVSKVGEIEMGVYTPGNALQRKWVGLPGELDWAPEMQLGHGVFGQPPTIRRGSFDCIRATAAELNLACIGPRIMLDGWQGFCRGPFAEGTAREVWGLIHESRKQDHTLDAVRNWAKDCFTGLRKEMVA